MRAAVMHINMRKGNIILEHTAYFLLALGLLIVILIFGYLLKDQAGDLIAKITSLFRLR